MKTNFHTHTYRCGHAKGTDEEYVQSAIDARIEILGFSDHSPWPYKTEYRPNVRMDITRFDEYVYSMQSIKERYKDRIDIRIGLECEYFEEFMPWLTETLAEKGLYTIFGNHFPTSAPDAEYFGHSTKNAEHLDYYVETALRGMEYARFLYLAHPDLFMRAYPQFDEACAQASRKICEKAAKIGMPLEINLGGYEMSEEKHIDCYPHDAFWRIAADCGCTCIIGYDAHNPAVLARKDIWDRAMGTVKSLGLKRYESIDEIEPRWH